MTWAAAIGWLLAGVALAAAWQFFGRFRRAESELTALRDRTRLALSDAEASIRRIRDDSDRARLFAAEPVLRDVLELVDSLDRAVASGEGGPGVERIHRQSVDLLKRHGAVRIRCVDQPFDPREHEAVATSPAPGPPQRVLAELAAGYHLHARLLRPARVVVAVPEEAQEAFLLANIDPDLLASERDRVIALLRETVSAAEIFEVGSTAVPGVIGKGDLDILVRAEASRFGEVRERLDGILARNPDQLSNEIYQGYRVESPLDVAVQLTVTGGPHDTFLPFIEALRADASLVERYNELKRTWHGRPMDAYRQAKAEFVRGVLDATPLRQ
jgi:molecular chaperone GrpE (heat shock protein)/GrpB-like predicted nucleotidyltransferase (UPF0157 family)